MPLDKRPTKYSKELAEEICRVIASTSEGLCQLCKKRPHWPWKATIKRWRKECPEFQKRYKAAKEAQTQVIVDDAVKIIGNSVNAYITTKQGRRVVNHNFVRLAKLIVETKAWLKSSVDYQSHGDINR